MQVNLEMCQLPVAETAFWEWAIATTNYPLPIPLTNLNLRAALRTEVIAREIFGSAMATMEDF